MITGENPFRTSLGNAVWGFVLWRMADIMVPGTHYGVEDPDATKLEVALRCASVAVAFPFLPEAQRDAITNALLAREYLEDCITAESNTSGKVGMDCSRQAAQAERDFCASRDRARKVLEGVPLTAFQKDFLEKDVFTVRLDG